MPQLWSGLLSVSVTPFDADGAVDFERFSALLDAGVAGGADGVIVTDAVGEFHSLSRTERRALYARTVADCRLRRVPVIAGISDLRVSDVLGLCAAAEQAGCDGALVMPPPVALPDAREVMAFFQQVAEATDLPLMLDHAPARSGVTLDLHRLDALVALPSVRAIREPLGDPARLATLTRRYGDRLAVILADDTGLRAGLSVGASGLASDIHQAAGRLIRTYYDAVVTRAADVIARLEPVVTALGQCCAAGSRPAAIKATMRALGLEAGAPRPPLLPLTETAAARIAALLDTVSAGPIIRTLD